MVCGAASTLEITGNRGVASAEEAKRQLNDPKIRRQREAALNKVRRGADRGRSPFFDQRPRSPEEQALDYLLGNDG